MMRWWAVIVIGVVMLGVGPVWGTEGVNANPDLSLMWQQARSRPDDFSLACMPLNDRTRTVVYNPGEQFPLASVSKVLIFIEYARRVDAGLIPMGEMVLVEQLNRYDVARTDRGAHDDFMDEYGRGRQNISLWDVAAEGMIRYSSNAAADYLLARMAPIDWASLYSSLNMSYTSYPHPLGMIPLLMNNHDTGQPTLEDVSALSLTQGMSYMDDYVNDADWRAAEVTYRTSQRRNFPDWGIQAAILQQHTATGTVYDFMQALVAIYAPGGMLTENTKQMVRAALRWENNSRINTTYIEYGSKLGFYSGGTLTLVAYGYPYEGQPVISAVFMRNIPRTSYRDLLRADSIGSLAHWMNLNSCAGLSAALS